MKKLILIYFFNTMIGLVIMGQENTDKICFKQNSISFRNGYLDWEEIIEINDFQTISLHYERLIKSKKIGYTSINIGGGIVKTLFDNHPDLGYANFGFNKLFGRNHHFFETGLGLAFFGRGVILNPNIGYRFMFGKRFLLKGSIDLLFPSFIHGYSLSCGFRF